MTTRKLAPELAPPIGFPLLGRPDADGRWTWPRLPRSVADGLRCVLATRPGELLLHPDFGAGVQDFLHLPNNLAVRARLHDRVAMAVERFEPRAQIDRIDVGEDPDDARVVHISVHYRLRRTGEPAQVALALTLGS
jgi:phage baseplate assembly protein W